MCLSVTISYVCISVTISYVCISVTISYVCIYVIISYVCLSVTISYVCLSVTISYVCIYVIISYVCLSVMISYVCLSVTISYVCLSVTISYVCLSVTISYVCLSVTIIYDCLSVTVSQSYVSISVIISYVCLEDVMVCVQFICFIPLLTSLSLSESLTAPLFCSVLLVLIALFVVRLSCWIIALRRYCERNVWSTTGVARIFVWEAPGRRHPVSHHSCTRLKMPCALQHSTESCVEPQSEIKIAQNGGEMTFGGGFL